MTQSPTTAAAVDVGVTLGELDGHPVVVAAFATAGITTQLQLPPASAAAVGAAMLQAATAAGFDVAQLLDDAAAGAGIVVPSLADTARIDGRR